MSATAPNNNTPNNNAAPIYGILDAFFETGTEGVLWALQDEKHISTDAKGNPAWSYDGLNILKNGDLLTVFADNKRDVVLWRGVINLDPNTNRQQFEFVTGMTFTAQTYDGFYVHGLQSNVDLKMWTRFFFDGRPAMLQKAPPAAVQP